MSCGSSFRLLTLCNAESASREYSTRLDSTCGDWHSFNNFLSLLYPVIVYITSGVLFGRCLAALVTTVIQKVFFVSPITLMHAHEPLCDSTLGERERKKEFLLVLLGELCTTCTFIYIGAYTVQCSAVQYSLTQKEEEEEEEEVVQVCFVVAAGKEEEERQLLCVHMGSGHTHVRIDFPPSDYGIVQSPIHRWWPLCNQMSKVDCEKKNNALLLLLLLQDRNEK